MIHTVLNRSSSTELLVSSHALQIDGDAELALMLTAGGDERIALDPVTRRNKYGTLPLPAPSEVFFSSSTASSITPYGFAAVADTWRRLKSDSRSEMLLVDEWFDDIRGRIKSNFGVTNCDVILAASGTETEYLAVAIALSTMQHPLTNIVIAPEETGRGVVQAANGSHFLATAPFGDGLQAGARLPGLEAADIHVQSVEIRDFDGLLRTAESVDDDVLKHALLALSKDRGVLAHLLDISKTGRAGLGLQMATRIAALAPERIIILADCCQLRSSPERVRMFLNCGFMVAVTGSKFAGGPPFCGALIVPHAILDRIATLALPEGLASHTSLLDWPQRLRDRVSPHVTSHSNLGLGLRWTAALAETEKFFAVPRDIAERIQARFKSDVVKFAQSVGLSPIAQERPAADWADTIIPIEIRNSDGSFASQAMALACKDALRAPMKARDSVLERMFHLGQPVAIGSSFALRVCLSAPMISDVAAKFCAAGDFEEAVAPLSRDIADLFAKWSILTNGDRSRKTSL